MALSLVQLAIDSHNHIPPKVKSFLDRAAAQVDAFIDDQRGDPIAGFVPSDYAQVYRVLSAMRQGASALAPGNAFCEWGSGLGIVACLAAMLGFDATAIEIEPRLVAASQELIDDVRLPVRVVQGSYVPDDVNVENEYELSKADMTLTVHGPAAYDELGLDPDDFDCIYAYPWPGEEEIIAGLFDRCAARGAILMTYHGQDGILVRRKR